MSRANGLRVWRDYLAGIEGDATFAASSLALLRLTIETAISEIEALEMPELLDALAAKARRELEAVGRADAFDAGLRSGKVSLLARYRAGRAPSDGGAA